MQKLPPNSRSSIDENQRNRPNTSSSYDRGYADGFEAGHASLGNSTVNRRSLSQGNRDRDYTSSQQTRIKTFNKDKPIQQTSGQRSTPPTGRFSGGFQTRQSLDKTRKSYEQPQRTFRENRDHEMEGQISSPEATVKYNRQGHY